MGKSIKIEPRTLSFLSTYERLKADKKLPRDSELLSIMGIKNPSTLSEIKGKRQNIQPDAWDKFRKHFNISEKTEPTTPNVKTLESLADSTAKLSESNLINARNIDRLITLLENKPNSVSVPVAEMQEIHSAKLYAIEEYILELGQTLRHSDRKTESVVLGKLEGEGFRLGEGIYTPGSGSEDKQRSQEKTATSES